MLFRKVSTGFSKSVVIFYPNFTNFLHKYSRDIRCRMVVDKYQHYIGKLSCVCGSVRISNFNHITKIVTFSASLLLSIRWYLFKDGFSKAHQLNYTVQGGNVSFVSDVAWLHNRHYPVIWMYSLTCIQPGGGDDHADQRKALRTQSICSRSMVQLTFTCTCANCNSELAFWEVDSNLRF